MAEASSHGSLASMIDRNFLECSICTGPFDDPRALPCLHPFCCGCLENWTKACSTDGKELRCPLCKEVYQVPDEKGIKGFPAHFIVADLQSTVDKVKQGTSTHDLCEHHEAKKIYYCENCDCAVCSDCSALDPNHRGHTFIRLKQAALQQSRSLGDLTSRVKDVENKFATAVQHAQQLKQDLDKEIDTKIKSVEDARNELFQQVDNLVAEFQQEIHCKGDEQTKAIDEMMEKLQSDVDTIRSTCELATNVAESGSESDIITLYPSLSSSLQQLVQSQPSAADRTLGQIQLDPPPQQTTASWEQLLRDKLHITPSPSQHNHDSSQTRRLSAKAAVTANSNPLAATTAPATKPPLPSSTSSSAKLSSTSTKPTLSAAAANLSYAAAVTPKLSPSSTKQSLKSSRGPKPTLSAAKTESARSLTLGNPGSKAAQRSQFSLSSSFRSAPRSLIWKNWKEIGKIKTAPQARRPRGIAVHPEGMIAVTSNSAPVSVLSRNGTGLLSMFQTYGFKHVIKGSPSHIYDIAITPSNQYVIPGKPGSKEFYIHNDAGVLCKTIKSKSSSPNSVAVDSTGRIITGLNQDKTVCIHQADGTLISKFQTQSSPRRLTCTPDDRLIISFKDTTLQVMDQSGHNASIIYSSPVIQSWEPWYVCCSKQGELFVGNHGDPVGVYRYISIRDEYKYLGCITWTGSTPHGIALSADEEKLFVVDWENNVIKIYE